MGTCLRLVAEGMTKHSPRCSEGQIIEISKVETAALEFGLDQLRERVKEHGITPCCQVNAVSAHWMSVLMTSRTS